MSHQYVASQLDTAAALLRSVGPGFEEALWRLGAVHPERWVSPAAHAMVDRVSLLRTKARILNSRHAEATVELQLATAMARGDGQP